VGFLTGSKHNKQELLNGHKTQNMIFRIPPRLTYLKRLVNGYKTRMLEHMK